MSEILSLVIFLYWESGRALEDTYFRRKTCSHTENIQKRTEINFGLKRSNIENDILAGINSSSKQVSKYPKPKHSTI